MRTPVCDQLGIDIPLFAFSHCRDVVAAVSKAGGFGVLGALSFTPEELEVELAWIDENCDGRPYGVDLVMPATYIGKGGAQPGYDEMAAMIPEGHRDFVDKLLSDHGVPEMPAEAGSASHVAAGLGVDDQATRAVDVSLKHENVKLLVNALGPPPKEVVDKAHAHGVLVAALVGSAPHARKQLEIGVDIIVAQGGEAGGHTGEIATMVLVPEVVDAVGAEVPVLAAGGIGTGRQMAAGLALGAQGAWTGSMWLTVAEAHVAEAPLANILAMDSKGTVRSRAMTGKPARQLKTAWTDAWEGPDSPGTLPMPLQGILHQSAMQRVMRVNNRELAGYPVGQIAGRFDRVRPARELVREVVEEWIATTERMSALLDD